MNNNSNWESGGTLHPDRLFPADPGTRAIARRLYNTVRALPIISPHGHTDPRWFADNAPFTDPVSFLLTPNHHITRSTARVSAPRSWASRRSLSGRKLRLTRPESRVGVARNR